MHDDAHEKNVQIQHAIFLQKLNGWQDTSVFSNTVFSGFQKHCVFMHALKHEVFSGIKGMCSIK